MAYLGNVPARSFISFERQVFTIVNSQTAYTLSHSVTNENDIRLVVNNVVQEPGSGKAYTASGTTLTLSAALTNGTDEMYCVFLGRAVGTVNAPAGSVGTSQLASDAVTNAKIADDAISDEQLDPTVITGQTAETSIATDDLILLSDTSASGALRKMTRANFVSGIGGTNTPFTTVKKSSDQTLSHQTDTLITFDAVVNESASNIFDLTNNKFTVATAGTYLILPQLRFYDSDNHLERVQLNMRINGSVRKSFIYYDAGSSSNGNGTREVCLGSGFLETLSASDYIDMYAYIATSGGGSLVAESDHLGTTLGVMKIIT